MDHEPVAVVGRVVDLAAAEAARLPEAASFWIIYPKQKKRAKMSFNENNVRELGLAQGFVDYKVCSVDAAWSGLKFSRRRT